MQVTIAFKQLEHTPALDERIHRKSARFSKILGASAQLQWVCWVEDHTHWAEAKLTGGPQNFFAKASAETMYKTLDKVVAKLERQISRHRGQGSRLHSGASLKRHQIAEAG
jgi:putative sigma-54 modulation protein